MIRRAGRRDPGRQQRPPDADRTGKLVVVFLQLSFLIVSRNVLRESSTSTSYERCAEREPVITRNVVFLRGTTEVGRACLFGCRPIGCVVLPTSRLRATVEYAGAPAGRGLVRCRSDNPPISQWDKHFERHQRHRSCWNLSAVSNSGYARPPDRRCRQRRASRASTFSDRQYRADRNRTYSR